VLTHWVFPQILTAHGTGYRIISDNRAITAEFYYSDGEPMNYADVLVFSPQDKKTEYQNGRCDRQGRFAFYPDASGAWRIEVNDGMGHKVRGSVEIRELKTGEMEPEKNITAPNDRTETSSMLLRCVSGLSMIFNLYFVVYLWKRKTKAKQTSY